MYKFNETFYIAFLEGKFLLTNVESGLSYELDKESFLKLAEENADQNEDFINAGLIKGKSKYKQSITDWPLSPFTRLFHTHICVKDEHLSDFKNEEEFWQVYLSDCKQAIDSKVEHYIVEKKYLATFDLPSHRNISADLYQTLKARRTIREFQSKSITQQELADILFIAFGKFHDSFENKWLDTPKNFSWRRSSPSAGGLHSVEAYVFISRVEGLEEGMYLYDSKKHQLHLIKLAKFEQDLERAMSNQRFLHGSAFSVLTVADLRLVAYKYNHSRTYILPYLDNGHLMQTALLTATALNLQTWISAAVCSEFMVKSFDLKDYQIPLCLLSVGHGYKDSLGPTAMDHLEKIKHTTENKL